MNFPTQIKIFLSQLGLDLKNENDPEDNADRKISTVPKSKSAGKVNDIMIFRYMKKNFRKSFIGPVMLGGVQVEGRILVLKKPITRQAKTGNLLLTGVALPVPGDAEYTPADRDSNFKVREDYPEDGYRTFIMSNIVGPLYRLR